MTFTHPTGKWRERALIQCLVFEQLLRRLFEDVAPLLQNHAGLAKRLLGCFPSAPNELNYLAGAIRALPIISSICLRIWSICFCQSVPFIAGLPASHDMRRIIVDMNVMR